MREKFNRIFLRYSNSAIARGFVATVLGSGASRVLLVLTTFCVARILSQDDFGQFSFVRSTLEMILSICAVNFSALCTKFTSESGLHNSSLHKLLLLFFFCMVLCCLLGGVLLMLPEHILTNIFLNQQIVAVFRIVGVVLPILFLAPLMQGVFRGWQEFKLLGIIQTSAAAFFLIVAVISAYYLGVVGALWSVVSYYVFYSVLISLKALQRINIRNLKSRAAGFISEYKVLYRVILPMFAMSFVEAPAFWLSQLLLSHAGGYGAIGAMTVIMQIKSMILIIPGYFFGTFMSFASKMNAEGNYKSYFDKFNFLIIRIAWLALICAIVLVIFGRPVLGIFGQEYVGAYIPYIIAMVTLPCYLIGSLLRVHFVVRERQRSLLFISIMWNVVWLASFALILKFDSDNSLLTFFVTQGIAVVIYLISLLTIYYKDRKKLLYDR